MKPQYKAPWDTLLQIITVTVSVFFIALAVSNTTIVSVSVAGAIILIPAFFTIRGYSLEGDTLIIHRLGWNKEIDLAQLKKASVNHKAMKGSWRLLGNGGMFGYIGSFRNKQLGTYRAYATHHHKCVVLNFSNRTLVITPNRSEEFVSELQSRSDIVIPDA